MKKELKEQFIILWNKYFGDVGLLITFYYTEGDGGAKRSATPKGQSLICDWS